MQEVILLGRKIRDTKKIAIKTPLQKAVVIESNQENVKRLQQVQQYIKDELNCLEIEFQSDEGEYVVYKSEPNNEPCGKAFKKDYGKLKGQLQNLTKEQILEYLQNKKVNVGGFEIVEGMLQISRTFNEKYSNHAEYSVDSDLENSVMLFTVLNDTLKKMGASREIITTTQQLRKQAGVNIDDSVEIFFELNKGVESW
eukprot:CAMPEP_0170545398 /NCGR_PEP_ID=MMETSP0211-20121228/3799_1 /TAXON_ID=311385 /ORGANISM="Pseudokeronopsis sp., Strain OXSARD2" /LENGTH=197 /DNA_ID=CAMNT_0010849291 /DNA_START=2512 /DNA_END=3102 /DNA_ORIENTATION=+